jgi:UDP-2-acetamido-3-amino-2,3-dideoxy-glucuronate N-acetyltransferase
MVFDDTKPWSEKLTLFHDTISMNDRKFIVDRAVPVKLPIAESEPLKDEMRAFITCCRTGLPATSDITEALKVQIVLDQMQTALIDTNNSKDQMPDEHHIY